MRTEALAKWMPACSYSSRIQPAPIPTCSRPPEQDVEGRQLLGEHGRMAEILVENGLAQPDGGGRVGHGLQGDEGAKGIMRWSATPKVE